MASNVPTPRQKQAALAAAIYGPRHPSAKAALVAARCRYLLKMSREKRREMGVRMSRRQIEATLRRAEQAEGGAG